MDKITNFLYSVPAMCVWVPLGVLVVALYVKDFVRKLKHKRTGRKDKR